jgi:xylulokinase
MAWLAREDPAAVARARWLLASWDAVGLWLSGEAATTVQAHETGPAGDQLAAIGVPGAAIAPSLAFGSRLGSLRPEAATALGLRAGIPVVAGVNDGAASMLGAGLRRPGDAVDTGGTSGGIGIYADRPVDVPGAFVAPAPLPGRWVVGGAMAALGASVDWMRTSVLGGRWSPDELVEAAARVEPGAGGLVFLPYLAGERAPIFDEGARGALVGLTLAHGPEHLARAALEGAAFAVRHVAEPLVAAGAPLFELRPAGRPSPGDAWARIKADVLGVPVAIPSEGETAVLGAAILAAVGVGAFGSLEEGVAAMTSVARRLEPDPVAHARYDELFGVYRALYPALRAVAGGTAPRA